MENVVLPLAGGALIGLAATGLLVFNGRVAGISGITAGLLPPRVTDFGWRLAFVLGLLASGAVLFVLWPEQFGTGAPPRMGLLLPVASGLLVGVGTQLGNGCTSGHGICGVSRGSPRSIVATLVFMATGMLSVLALRLSGVLS